MFMTLYKNLAEGKKRDKRKKGPKSLKLSLQSAVSISWCGRADFLALYLSCVKVKQINFSGECSGVT